MKNEINDDTYNGIMENVFNKITYDNDVVEKWMNYAYAVGDATNKGIFLKIKDDNGSEKLYQLTLKEV